MPKIFNLDKTYQLLLILLAFFLPLTVFGANTIIVVIVILWLLSGDYKSKFYKTINNKLLMASIIFFALHLFGLVWTEDFLWGVHILHKMWYFLLFFPVLFNIVKKDYVKYYITSFLVAISVTEVFSYLIWFQIISPFGSAEIFNPTPFMSHISYNPILAFAIYIVYHEVLFNQNLSKLKFLIYSFFAVTMTFNMFITGGRAGQVVYFVILAMMIFQFFNKNRIKALFAISVLIPGIFFTAYQTSPLFQERIDLAVFNSINYSENMKSSVGMRLAFAINSWEIIEKHPIIGVGTGDFPLEYNKVNNKNTPQIPYSTNPHNMYALILVQLGLVGLISMLSIFYYQIKIAIHKENKFFRDIGLSLPLIFLVVMLSDSYLLGHYTSLLFVFFSSFLYKDFEKY
jgi:O-antigen ligase